MRMFFTFGFSKFAFQVGQPGNACAAGAERDYTLCAPAVATPLAIQPVSRDSDSSAGDMKLKLWQVDAFAERPFAGNPAAVVPLDAWLPDEVMQAIANENNL